jgi:hypothetical protein
MEGGVEEEKNYIYIELWHARGPTGLRVEIDAEVSLGGLARCGGGGAGGIVGVVRQYVVIGSSGRAASVDRQGVS